VNRSIIEVRRVRVGWRSFMKIPRILLLALFFGGGLIWFCVSRAASATGGYSLTLREANEQKILLITVGSEPRTLDPHEAQGVTEHHIIMAMIEGLVAPSIDDQAKVVPGMADRWEHNDDYSVWTFHIGEDRKWSDGEPVKAGDFVFSYKRMLTASFGSSRRQNRATPVPRQSAFSQAGRADAVFYIFRNRIETILNVDANRPIYA